MPKASASASTTTGNVPTAGGGRNPTAAILLIGNEILSGKVQDENARFLIGELRDLGVSLRRIEVVPDDVDDIAASVRGLAERFDTVFTSGGVGPTHDDVTMAAVARAFEMPWSAIRTWKRCCGPASATGCTNAICAWPTSRAALGWSADRAERAAPGR